MNRKKGMEILRSNAIFYITGILAILGIKLYYSRAGCDALLWILAPTARWVEFLSGIPFTYVPGTGYVNHSLRMVIAASCSGVRFMTITFGMLVFSFLHLARPEPKPDAWEPKELSCGGTGFGLGKGIGWIAASAVLSWLCTVFVNGLRIITAVYLPLYLQGTGLMGGILTQGRLHTIIGVTVYFTALLTIYRLVGWFFHSTEREPHTKLVLLRKCAPPACWYLLFTLGLPLLNRAGHAGTGEFTEFAILVTVCCGFILLPYAAAACYRSLRDR